MHSGTCAPHRPPPSAQLFRGGGGEGCRKTTFRNSFPIFPVAAVIGKTLWMALWLLPPPPPEAVNWNHVLIDEEKPRALEVGPVTNLPLVALATAIPQLQVNCMGANRGKKKGGGEKLQQKKSYCCNLCAKSKAKCGRNAPQVMHHVHDSWKKYDIFSRSFAQSQLESFQTQKRPTKRATVRVLDQFLEN